MAVGRGLVEQDYIIGRVRELFPCRVLWSEGRPCLEYDNDEMLNKITEYIRVHYDTPLLDVFFTAIESLPSDD